MHTKESIQALLARSDKAVYRALVVLYERQTADEQSSEVTNHLNGVGFNATDAKFCTSLAKQILAWDSSKYRYPLSRKQLDKGRAKVHKYAGQLANIANEKVAVPC